MGLQCISTCQETLPIFDMCTYVVSHCVHMCNLTVNETCSESHDFCQLL